MLRFPRAHGGGSTPRNTACYATAHRAMSTVDLLVCATAALRDLGVLHDGGVVTAAARYLPDLRERSIQNAPRAD
jgi:hypothetical protein